MIGSLTQLFCATEERLCLRGPKGEKGQEGTRGIPGIRGERGLAGPLGPKGEKGKLILSLLHQHEVKLIQGHND